MSDEFVAEAVEHHETPDNPDLSRQVATDLRTVARKAHHIELCIVIVTAALVLVAAAASGWNTYRIRALASQNKTGVDRIVDCTTQGHGCYEEQQARQSLVVADALLQLNEEHLAIECILLTLPARRTQSDIDACRAEAAKKTAAARADLRRRITDSVTTTTPGNP
jgi:hypothetical protein